MTPWRIDIGFGSRLLMVFVVIALALATTHRRCLAQEAPAPSRPITVPLRPPSSPSDSILSPIPQQFEWMQRVVPSNPLLESLAGFQDVENRLSFSLTLSGEYNDNFRGGEDAFADEGSDDNIRTALTLGTLYYRERKREARTQSFLSLANTISGTYDTIDEDAQIGFTNLALNTGYTGPRFSLAVSDNLVLDDDRFGYTNGLADDRRRFFTNNFNPQMQYLLSRLSSMTFSYANRIVVDLEEDDIDSISHSIAPGFRYRFSRFMEGRISYTLRYIDSQARNNEGLSHNIDTNLDWIFSANTNFLFGLGVLIREESHSVRLSAGFSRQLSALWSLAVSVGPSYVSRTTQDNGTEDESQDIYMNWNASLNGKIASQTSLTLTTSQFINDTSGEVVDQGLVLRSSAVLSLGHAFTPNLHSTLSISYGRNDPLGDSASNDPSVSSEDNQFIIASLGGTYALTSQLLLSLRYQYEQRFSDDEADDFQRNRVMLALSAAF